MSDNVDSKKTMLGSQSTAARLLKHESAKRARKVAHYFFEQLGIVEQYRYVNATQTEFLGNPTTSTKVRDFVHTIARRDKDLGRLTAHAMEIFSPTFCGYEVELAKLTFEALTSFLQATPTEAQSDPPADMAAAVHALEVLVSKLLFAWTIAAVAYISRIEAHRGVVYGLKIAELPVVGSYAVRDYIQVRATHAPFTRRRPVCACMHACMLACISASLQPPPHTHTPPAFTSCG